MRCRYCHTALAPSRTFVDGEFCCDDHRQTFETEHLSATPQPVTQTLSAALQMLRRRFTPRTRMAHEPELSSPELEFAPEEETESLLDAESYSAEAYADVDEESAQESAHESAHDAPARKTSPPQFWLITAWKDAPRDLKLVSLLLPVLLVAALTGSVPKVPIRQLAPQNLDRVQKVVEGHWKNLNQTVSNRAAIEYTDDFRSGLDAWESRSNLTRSWSYDAAGFVRPGPLAIFKPTVDLSDYSFEFLGEIDQKAMGWAFRAEDLNNYYAMKFVVVKPGPLPLVHMVRYAVIDGKQGPSVDKPLPMTVRSDMLYRIQVNVRGGDFTVLAQGLVVDFWSDNRLPHGGVGFFCNRGERARLRWVEVSHQYDALGRLCAYLAPYGIEGRNGDIN